jgi:Holliday junction resolvasome RuvABC endonuclease subunit
MNKVSIFSLDISSQSTGWSYAVKGRIYNYGVIKLKPTMDRAQRLVIFRKALKKLLKKYKPRYTVIENGFGGRNIKTLKTLAKFAGVAEELVRSELGYSPYIMNNKIVKSFHGVKTKEELFEVMCERLKKKFNFKEHNDICDAAAQSFCYYDTIVKEEEKIGKNH